jgi:hypothetical protein
MTLFKKTIALFIALLFVAGATYAQKNKKDEEEEKDPKKYKKLVDYYDKGKYADCLYSAEKWMDNDKYSKEPDIYLYASMSHLAVYKDPDPFPVKKYPEFKNPLKGAMKNFVKFSKKDKSGAMMEENKAFADELKSAVIMEAMDLYEKKENSKLTSISKDMIKTYDKDEAMLMLGGAYLLTTNNLSDGLKATDSSMVILKRKKDAQPQYSDDEQKALREGFIVYTDYLLVKKDYAKAKAAIALANEMLIPHDKLKEQMEKVVKSDVTK